MLIQRKNSLLLLIDLQQKLAPAIADIEQVTASALWLVQIAQQLDVPVLATEQYPQGLGGTLAPLSALLSPEQIIEKIHFSAWREVAFQQHLVRAGRQQIVIAGTEAHVCVLQTALDLCSAGYQVFLVVEATGARTASNKTLALGRLQQAGVVIVSQEMLAFEWLERAGTDLFRHINQGWIR